MAGKPRPFLLAPVPLTESSLRKQGPITTNAGYGGIAAPACRKISSGGYGSRIAFADAVIGRAFARAVGSLVRDDVNHSLNFFLRWPSVRSRKALSLMKPAASR